MIKVRLYSNTTKEHTKHLEHVFQNLIGYKLHVHTKNTSTHNLRWDYWMELLGHDMTHFKANLDVCKVKAIKKWEK